MNTKNNQRFQDSEKKIQSALLELLKTEKAQDITVQDICKKAEVNRTTFYAHFSDIRELTESSEIQIREAIMMAFQEDGSEQQSGEQWQLFFLHSMEDYGNFYHLYFQYHKNEPAQNGPAQVWLSTVYGQLDRYRQVFYQAGVEAILRQWAENGCKDSPEEIQSIISQRLSKNFL